MARPYTFTEESGSILVEWMSWTLPVELQYFALGLLIVLPFLFVFRGAFSRFADRHLHIHWPPKVYGILAPVLSVICGTILLLARPVQPFTTWKLDNEGISVRAPEGTTDLKWSDLGAVQFEPVSKGNFTLVLTTKNGEILRLPLFQIDGSLQEKIVEWVGHHFRLDSSLPDVADELDLDEPLPSPPSAFPKK